MQKYVVPDFTIKDLLDVIPAHCFKRNAFYSFLYVIWDFSLLAALTYGVTKGCVFLQTLDLPPYYYYGAQFALWSAYWFAGGLAATGLWVLAHECGHQAFSESKTLNNAVGFVLHSSLGVPYHSWRISHGRHHAATGHMTRDQVFVPITRSEHRLPAFDENREDREGRWIADSRQKELREALEETPLYQVYKLLIQQLGGWQTYLIANISGQLSYPAGSNHFNPNSVIFDARHYWQIVASDIGIALWLGALATWAYYRGIAEVALFYLPIYLWVNHWLVMITFLQHTDPLLPHYRAGAWTFPRGALATMDRTLMGPIGGWFLHGIAETHVSHHVHSKIPHYHAWEATRALKARLGPAYMESKENMFKSFWVSYKECRFVEDKGDVVFFKNAKGFAKSVAVFSDKGMISDSGVDVQ
ncbi:delta-12 fatty acid desaturase [Dacryopinax primogenitus]|uniref:Delta-12 fatty acid desaturase n=1 Tax=Dacryopinax primogenitus (strain DJM 731) TaxID=1858805 RepID=M5G114_DACPD|nr:delta-12 fatty acid desaturase [Dacryopinax primogenitus]EJT97472.1 delta-12 fatty acid desaturase [Dacryopinax primogenitus]